MLGFDFLLRLPENLLPTVDRVTTRDRGSKAWKRRLEFCRTGKTSMIWWTVAAIKSRYILLGPVCRPNY